MTDDPIRLPRLLDEKDVAAALHCSVATVTRERRRGRLGFTRIGGRIRYTENQVQEYLENQREDPCLNNKTDFRSGNTGSADSAAAQTGAGHGLIRDSDRQSAHRLAQQILKKPNSDSPNT
jgi:excisionase family DNA binding protein